jgi:hypothetical protein
MNRWKFVLLLTAVLGLGLAAPTWAQDDAVNGNGGAAANDSSLAATVLNDEVEGDDGAAANDTSLAANDILNDEVKGDDGAAANSTTGAVSVAVNDTLNGLGNDDEVKAGKNAANDDSEITKQDAGENAANNGGQNNKQDAGTNAANDDSEINTLDAGTNAANNGGEINTQDGSGYNANNGGEINRQEGDANANNGGTALRINDIFVAVSVVDLDATVTGNNPNINTPAAFTTGDNTVNSGTTFEVNGINQINQNSGFYNVSQQSNSFAVTFQGPKE